MRGAGQRSSHKSKGKQHGEPSWASGEENWSPNSPHASGSHVAISLGCRRADRKERNSTFSLCQSPFPFLFLNVSLLCPCYSFFNLPLCISPAWSLSPWRLSLWDLLSVCSQNLTFNSLPLLGSCCSLFTLSESPLAEHENDVSSQGGESGPAGS